MVLEEFLPFGPAHVKALLLPVGRIKRSRYTAFVERLLPENVVRLGDISPDGRSDRTMFSPLAFPNGRLIFDFSTSQRSLRRGESSVDVLPEPLIIIGIADAKEYRALESDEEIAESTEKTVHDAEVGLEVGELDDAMANVRRSFETVLSHTLLVFDCLLSTPISLPEHSLLVPTIGSSRATTVKTILCDLAAIFLADLSLFGRALLSRPFRAADEPGRKLVSQPLDTRSTSVSSTTSHLPRDASPFRPASSNSQREDRNSTSYSARVESRSTEKPRTTDSSIPLSFTVGSQQRLQKMLTSIPWNNTHSRECRLKITIGALYLVSGRWLDALKHLADGANEANRMLDILFLGKALELIVICALLLFHADMLVDLPPICFVDETRVSAQTQWEQANIVSISSLASSKPEQALERLKILNQQIPRVHDRILTFYQLKSISAPHRQVCVARFTALEIHLLWAQSIGQLNFHELVCGSNFPLVTRDIRLIYYEPNRKRELAERLMKALEYPVRTYGNGHISSKTVVRESQRIEADAKFLTVSLLMLERLGMHRKAMFTATELSKLQYNVVKHAEDSIAHLSGSDLTEADKVTDAEEEETVLDITENLEVFADLHDILHAESGFSPALKTLVQRTSRSNHRVSKKAIQKQSNEALGESEGRRDIPLTPRQVLPKAGYPNPELFEQHSPLNTEEEVDLSDSIDELDRQADDVQQSSSTLDYWDDHLVCGLEHVETLHEPTRLLKRSFPDSTAASAASDVRSGHPFIHASLSTPQRNATEDQTVVVGELLEFLLLLRNPSPLDIEIESLQMVTSGPRFDTSPYSGVLKPSSLVTCLIAGKALEPGSMKIVGYFIQLKGFRRRQFRISSGRVNPHPFYIGEAKRFDDMASLSQVRMLSQTSHKVEPDLARGELKHPPPQRLPSFNVISEQPTLVLHSLEKLWLVMNGETKIFTLAVHNVSNVIANFLRFETSDDAAQNLSKSAKEGKISRTDAYDFEHSQARQRAVSIKKQRAGIPVCIEQGTAAAVEVEVFGSRHLTEALIRMYSAHTPQSAGRSDNHEEVFVREKLITIPIIAAPSVEVIPHVVILRPADGALWLRLSLRNATAKTMSAFVAAGDQEYRLDISSHRTATRLIQLPPLEVGDTHRMIPGRQFVVEGRTQGEVAAERLAFWHRESLLKALTGRWEDEGGRTGVMDFRPLKLTAEDVELLADILVGEKQAVR